MDQKILWDCHMHSSFSADSDTPMEEMIDRKSTRLNSSHSGQSRMPSSA